MAVTVRPTLSGSASLAGPGCVERAVSRAVEGLGGRPASIVLVFPPASLPAAESAARAAAAARGAPIAGMTSADVFGAGAQVVEGCSALAFDESVEVGVGVASRASRDPRAAGRDAVADAFAGVDREAGHPLLLLFVDPNSGDCADIVRGAYEVAGAHVPQAGGGANGRHPAVLAGGAAHEDAVVAVALVLPGPVGVGISHGCRFVGAPSIVTRTRGHTILTLDGRPAESVYLERLGRPGVKLRDSQFETLSVLHPLAQPELSGQVRLRHIKGQADAGGLACAARIPVDAVVAFTEQTPETILASAREAVADALEPLGGAARAALVFDCGGRRRALGPAAATEAAAIASAFPGGPPPMAGLWTRGEVGRVRGPLGDRNHAIVVVAFG
jgi:hypothetical protein